ncbi:hypothetical protein [uncultured Pseudokineococcus sp.]|uniref:hypothetical protein n=1 Tax=uncultured Pseudokineococcus sp. TaxID=1642928 RepID=UPI00262127C5|nr:hypothetical protein [uncultured Pseudokineococcus sp.]
MSTTNDVRTGRVRIAEHLLVVGRPVARDAALPVSAPRLAPVAGRPGGELRPQDGAVPAGRALGGLEPTTSSADLTSPVNGASGAVVATGVSGAVIATGVSGALIATGVSGALIANGASGAERPFRSCGTPVPGSAPTGTAP